MKIVLLNPPASHPKFVAPSDIEPHYPLGLLYIAAVLEIDGHDVSILDSVTMGPRTNISNAGEFVHFGATWEEIEAELSKLSPDVVGITNPYVTQFSNAITAAEIAKKVNPKILTVVGGPHATVRPQDFFEKTGSVDIVVIGEGEYTMSEIVRYLEGTVKLAEIQGIAYKENDAFRVNPERPFIETLDQLPLPAYHLIDNGKYFIRTSRPLTIITSRGCPFNCVFCTVHLHMGKKWRAHSTSYVLDHLEYAVQKLGIRNISFVDDNLSLDTKRFVGILDGIIQRNLNIIWDTPNGIRADTMNRELVSKSKQAGCFCFMMGVESGDQVILDNMVQKSLDLSKVIEFSKLCKEITIDMGAFFIIGFPGETKSNIEETLSFARMLNKEYKVMPMLGVATPYYGTALYELSKAGNCLLDEPTPENIMASADPGKGLIKTSDFCPEDLRTYYMNFYRGLILRF